MLRIKTLIEKMFGVTLKTLTDPEMDRIVNEINMLIKRNLLVEQEYWTPQGYSEVAKDEMWSNKERIKTLILEGGKSLRIYLTPWRGKENYDFSDLPKVRVARLKEMWEQKGDE